MNSIPLVSNQRGYPREGTRFSWDAMIEVSAREFQRMNDAMPISLTIPDFAVVYALARGNLLELLVKLDPDAVVVFTDIVVHEAIHGQDEAIAEQIGRFEPVRTNHRVGGRLFRHA